MKQRASARVALALFSISILLVIAALAFMLLSLDVEVTVFGFRGAIALLSVALASVGVLLAYRRPENPIGWILLVSAALAGLQALGQELRAYAVARGWREIVRIWDWIDLWLWVPMIGLIAIYAVLLFPTGRPASRRWRWVLWAGALGIVVLSLSEALASNVESGALNPVVQAPKLLIDVLFAVGSLVYVASFVGAVVSLIARFRRSRGDERQQLKWFAAASTFAVVSFVGLGVQETWFPGADALAEALAVAIVLSFVAIALATGVAVLKYRLYDIDVVISKTVVFGLVAAFITFVYVGVVVGLGAAIVGARANTFLTLAAAAIVALAFHPVREWAHRLANRLVYGERATPYEVLSQFSHRVATTYSVDDVLPRMARMLADGTGAESAGVWLRVGDELRLAASWPNAGREGERRPLRGRDRELPELGDATRTAAVRHQGDLLGALTLTKPASDPISPTEEKLLNDLASQAGLVLRNVRLTEDLRARLDELQASRKRLVAAQDEERRRLERNIHDGAQQQLVALAVKLRLSRAMVDRDPERAKEMLSQVEHETTDALENLRDLARGIYPPLLQDQGLQSALQAQARKSPVPVEVSSDSISRYPQEAEAAVYFCCLEALQNVAKYAGATTVRITLSEQDGELAFSVSDDGVGFDPETTPKGSGLQNMADRLAAIGGELEISSTPGEGTTVKGRVPVRTLEPVA